MDELRGDRCRDPFVDPEDVGDEMGALLFGSKEACRQLYGPVQKVIFRMVPQRSGTVTCLWFRVPHWTEAARGTIQPFSIFKDEPTEILAPSGWVILGMVTLPNGDRWTIPFAEVPRPPRPEEIH